MIRVLLLLVIGAFTANSNAASVYDIAINGGRLIDPDSGIDAICSVGIRDGSVVKISKTDLSAARIIDANGLIVSPGFINLHSHAPTSPGQRFEVLDGITTALELEGGAYPVETFGSMLSSGALINYGASVGHMMIRMQIVDGSKVTEMISEEGINLGGNAWLKNLDSAQLEQMREELNNGIRKGGLGIGLALDYLTAAVDESELSMIFEVAGERGVPVFVHVRRGIAGDPAGLIEVIDQARKHDAALQIVHINASAMGGITNWLKLITEARSQGVDVTTEMFPWTAGSTSISASVFTRNWREIFAIDYGDVQWAANGEFLTEESFNRYQNTEPAGQTIHHYIKEEWNRIAIQAPFTMVASDAMPLVTLERKVVPNGIGTSAKILGRYVREDRLLNWTTAIEKLSLLPARRLESFAPTFRNKGRIRVGGDADITVFDPKTVIDRATYLEPFQPSVGIKHVIVNGIEIVRDAKLVEGVYPGRRLLAED